MKTLTENQKSVLARLNELLDEVNKNPIKAMLVDNPFDINNPI